MTIRSIDAATARTWLDHDEAVLIDVREPSEHSAEHIAGARLVPLRHLSPADLEHAAGRLIIVHCQKGGRSLAACEKLQRALPDTALYNLDGGLTAWRSDGFATVSAPGAGRQLPLDRQVQLTVGLGLLTSCALGVAIHPAFFALAGVFGLGLTVAGLTGFCGLAQVLNTMPWNVAQASHTR